MILTTDHVKELLSHTGNLDSVNVSRTGSRVAVQILDQHQRPHVIRAIKASGWNWKSGKNGVVTVTAEDELGEEEAVDQIQSRVQKWKKHAQENATAAGWRKAKKGKETDPRVFANELAESTLLVARKTQSKNLFRLAKALKKVAGDKNPLAAKALLSKLEPEKRTESTPTIEKPEVNSPQLENPDNRDMDFVPGGAGENNNDNSWSSERASRFASVNQDLLEKALEFIQEYARNNSIKESNKDLLQSPEVMEAWIIDLDSQGYDTDEVSLENAWQEAVTQYDPEASQLEASLDTVVASERRKLKNQPLDLQVAPGGDWANTIVNPEENPGMDRYLKSISASRGNLRDAVDQCLDHFSGEMVPSEISPEDVQQFCEKEFPHISHKKVFESIQNLVDAKRRHQEEDEEEDCPDKKATKIFKRNSSRHINPTDQLLRSKKRFSTRTVCARCAGTGLSESEHCFQCDGKGRHASRSSSNIPYLTVYVDWEAAPKLVRQRVAQKSRGRAPSVFPHSTGLMKFLQKWDIPYATSSLRHASFGKGRKASGAAVLDGYSLPQLPYSVQKALEISGSTLNYEALSLPELQAAFLNHKKLILESTGKTTQEIFTELNDFLTENKGGRHSKILWDTAKDPKLKRYRQDTMSPYAVQDYPVSQPITRAQGVTSPKAPKV